MGGEVVEPSMLPDILGLYTRLYHYMSNEARFGRIRDILKGDETILLDHFIEKWGERPAVR